MTLKRSKQGRRKLAGSSEEARAKRKSDVAVEEPQTDTRYSAPPQILRSTAVGIGVQKLEVKWLYPPEPPKPPDGIQENVGHRVRGLHCVVEERKIALESRNSKITSASVAQTKVGATPSSALEEMEWEPPKKWSSLYATETEREVRLEPPRYDPLKQTAGPNS